MRPIAVVLVASYAMMGSQASFAYRPFDSTDASVAEPARVELELGPVGYVRDGHANVLVAPAVIANVGVVPNWEVVLQTRIGAPLTVSTLLGAIWRVREDLSLDVGLRRARVDDRDVSELRAGFTWGFPLERAQ